MADPKSLTEQISRTTGKGDTLTDALDTIEFLGGQSTATSPAPQADSSVPAQVGEPEPFSGIQNQPAAPEAQAPSDADLVRPGFAEMLQSAAQEWDQSAQADPSFAADQLATARGQDVLAPGELPSDPVDRVKEDLWRGTKAVGAGVLAAGRELGRFGLQPVDAALGTDLTKRWEKRNEATIRWQEDLEKGGASLAIGASQFTAGWMALGYLGKMKGAGETFGSTAKAAARFLKAGTVQAAFFNEDNNRLLAHVNQIPALRGPLANMLSNDPNDTIAWKRSMGALEAITLDAALSKFLGLFVRGKVKLDKGDVDGAAEDLAEAATAFEKYQKRAVTPYEVKVEEGSYTQPPAATNDNGKLVRSANDNAASGQAPELSPQAAQGEQFLPGDPRRTLPSNDNRDIPGLQQGGGRFRQGGGAYGADSTYLGNSDIGVTTGQEGLNALDKSRGVVQTPRPGNDNTFRPGAGPSEARVNVTDSGMVGKEAPPVAANANEPPPPIDAWGQDNIKPSETVDLRGQTLGVQDNVPIGERRAPTGSGPSGGGGPDGAAAGGSAQRGVRDSISPSAEAPRAGADAAAAGTPGAGDVRGRGPAGVAGEGNARAGVPDAPASDVRPRDVAPKLASQASRDAKAVEAHGSFDEALAAGERIGKPNFPWQKVVDEPKQLQDLLSEVVAADTNSAPAKAPKSDAKTLAEITRFSEAFGLDTDGFMMGLGKAASTAKTLEAQTLAAFKVAMTVARDMYTLANRIKMGAYGEYGTRDAALEALRKHTVAFNALWDPISEIRAFGGRMNRAWRGDLFEKVNLGNTKSAASLGMDDDSLVDAILNTQGRPDGIRQAVVPASFARNAIDGAHYVLMNSVMTATTHAINMVANTLMLPIRGGPVKALGALIGSGLKAVGVKGVHEMSATRQVALAQSYQLGAELFTGAKSILSMLTRLDGKGLANTGPVRAFIKGESIIDPHSSASLNVGRVIDQMPFRPMANTKDVLFNGLVAGGKLLGYNTRALGAADELFKGTIARSNIIGRATVEGQGLGLKGKDLASFVNRRVEEAFDEAGALIDPVAKREAEMATFSQPLIEQGEGTFDWTGITGRNMALTLNKMPAMKLVVPFLRTPINALRYNIRLTPGLNLVQKQFRDELFGLHGETAQAQAMGEAALATSLVGLAAYWAAQGNITGLAPENPQAAKAFADAGNKPGHVRLPATDTWVNLNRLDPVSAPMILTATLVQALKSKPELGEVDQAGLTKAVGAIMMYTVALAKDKSYLRGLSDFLDAMSDPRRDGERWVARMAASLIPLNATMRQINGDQYLREAHDFVTSFAASTIASSTLPSRIDAWGDPITAGNSLMAHPQHGIVEDEAARMAMDANVALASPPSPLKGGADLRDVTMQDGANAYETLSRWSGYPDGQKPLKKAAADLIQSETYRNAEDGPPTIRGTKAWLMQQLTSKYHSAAMERLMKDPAVLEAVQKKLMASKSAYEANKAGAGQGQAKAGLSTIQGIAQAFGLSQ
jgi:hypothetical protein